MANTIKESKIELSAQEIIPLYTNFLIKLV
jgi:hypothetical protein